MRPKPAVSAPQSGQRFARVNANVDAAREWVEELTRYTSRLRITSAASYDRMERPRLLIDLAIDGVDVGRAGIEAGHLAPRPHEGARALARKPNWCAD